MGCMPQPSTCAGSLVVDVSMPDKVYLRIDGRVVYLWRIVDTTEGEVLDVLVQRRRNMALSQKSLRACSGRAGGFAIPATYAARLEAVNALTFEADPSVGAGHDTILAVSGTTQFILHAESGASLALNHT